jgi:OHS family lactose permease-like MFS transporter
MNKISNKQLLMFVFILLMIQFFTYAFINILIIKIIVALLTKSVATMSYIMINMKVIATIVDQYHQMRALALVSTFKSLISIVFQSIGGYIIDIANYSSFYIFLFIISVIAFMITIFYKIDSGNDQQLFD